jgi:SAM-dependent methyltransferase
MKLSTLVNYRNQLDSISIQTMSKSVDIEIEKITHVVGKDPIQGQKSSEIFIEQQQTFKKMFDRFEQELKKHKLVINEQISEAEKSWFSESYRLFNQEMHNETKEDIQFRSPQISKESQLFYQSRIARLTGWKRTAMIVRPGFESWIHDMVSCDPLYLVDISYDLLVPALSLFNQAYQQRLRTYVVNEQPDQKILTNLPKEQFGLILAYNFFNFRPFELIKQWLLEFYETLRPGGSLLMTINDCDRDKGVMLAEQHFCCYTPGSLVCALAENIGFETTFVWHDNGASTWLEFTKPGEFESLRGGQTLAKIIPK